MIETVQRGIIAALSGLSSDRSGEIMVTDQLSVNIEYPNVMIENLTVTEHSGCAFYVDCIFVISTTERSKAEIFEISEKIKERLKVLKLPDCDKAYFRFDEIAETSKVSGLDLNRINLIAETQIKKRC